MLDFLAENPKGLDTLIESIHKIGTQDFVITKIINEIQKVKSERNKAGRSPSPRSTFAVDSGVNIDTSSTHSSSLYYSEQQWNPNITSLDSLNLSSGAGMEVGAPLRSISLSSAASLPRPGDLGAPLIPEDSEAVPHSWSSSGSDDQFQTLRCHSLLAP
ncbi:BCL10 protein, partial [Amia calva]|nr:BCL10 protein [Amia calva]